MQLFSLKHAKLFIVGGLNKKKTAATEGVCRCNFFRFMKIISLSLGDV